MRKILCSILLLGLASGCVSQARYEEARSLVRVEQEAHRRTVDELRTIQQRIATMNASLNQKERQLVAKEEALAESRLANDVAEQDKVSATQTVEQLRGELSRVGSHLRSFAKDKRRLSAALEQAKVRAQRLSAAEKAAAERGTLVRDLTLLLAGPIRTGKLDLAPANGGVELRALTRLSKKEQRKIKKAVGRLAKLYPRTVISVAGQQGEELLGALKDEEGLAETRVRAGAATQDALRMQLDLPQKEAPSKRVVAEEESTESQQQEHSEPPSAS